MKKGERERGMKTVITELKQRLTIKYMISRLSYKSFSISIHKQKNVKDEHNSSKKNISFNLILFLSSLSPAFFFRTHKI